MIPSINGVWVKIYTLDDDAEKHDFRERVKERDKNYGLLQKLKAQPRWFTAEEIRFKEEINKFYSTGYFIFKASDLSALGISPAPDGKSWINYRLAPYINGSYSERLLNIVQVSKESPWKGEYKLWYVYFNEAKAQPVSDNVETPREKRETDDITKVVELVREY